MLKTRSVPNALGPKPAPNTLPRGGAIRCARLRGWPGPWRLIRNGQNLQPEAEKVRFHALNRATGNCVHARYVDAETGKPVDDGDQVKGYEREDGEYVMLEDEELDAVARESIRTIDIDCFVPANSIGWIW